MHCWHSPHASGGLAARAQTGDGVWFRGCRGDAAKSMGRSLALPHSQHLMAVKHPSLPNLGPCGGKDVVHRHRNGTVQPSGCHLCAESHPVLTRFVPVLTLGPLVRRCDEGLTP